MIDQLIDWCCLRQYCTPPCSALCPFARRPFIPAYQLVISDVGDRWGYRQDQRLRTVDDMWTSRATQAYLTVTCNFVHNWQIDGCVLEASCFYEQHIAANISSELKRITDDWGITDKVIAVITDNGANVVSAVHKAGWTHLHCFAHTLNLVVKDAINAVPQVVNLLQKCSNIVSFFHHSNKATQKLADIQKQLNKPEHNLVQSVETRWNSSYMLDRFLEQKEPVTTALCVLGRNDLCLSSVETDLIQPTIDALRPFEETTQEASASKHVSMSKVIPLVSLLLKVTASTVPSENSLARQLLHQCQRRFHSINIPLFHSIRHLFQKCLFFSTCVFLEQRQCRKR
ncbi:Zinc finger BED domain-containing protein 4 [Channa argus]|uniref:Zinc finger BED domain-containing protein 4 n=1 Tax=Channa argus TaxID=215402 RepID=A0A6G1PG70_CHAAH|nr:Zinc finger BED domain-containing protein 4 [Channa argus]